MRLILIRHYKTEFNVSGQIMGWGDSPPVDDWAADMEFVECVLAAKTVRPDAVYSSALDRAVQTARYFADQLDVADRVMAPELNEINYGTLYGKPKKWVAEHYPLHKKDPDFTYPQGESFRQLQSRCTRFISSLAESRPGQTVMCVAHAGVVRALLSHFLELDYTLQLKRKVSHRYIGVLVFEGARCASYDEWGCPSGFVGEGELRLPHFCKIA